MKRIAIVVFDAFTDIDLFLMWDILGLRESTAPAREAPTGKAMEVLP